MQYQRLGYWIRAFYRIAHVGLIESNMDEEVCRRIRILTHWREFGLASTIHAFGVSLSTLFVWKARLKQARGNTASLKPYSKRAKHLRTRAWDVRIVNEIARLCTVQANLGKEKCLSMFIGFCQRQGLRVPSVSTIGRMIASVPNQMRSRAQRLTPKGKFKN